MDIQEICNAISSVGFPIVACGALFYMINTTMKELRDVIASLEKAIIKVSGHEKENDE